jgi:hypothetical protein
VTHKTNVKVTRPTVVTFTGEFTPRRTRLQFSFLFHTTKKPINTADKRIYKLAVPLSAIQEIPCLLCGVILKLQAMTVRV